MYRYIAESYAGILTKGDIVQLFDGLTMQLGGNRSEAARRCGLTGKTTYDWKEVSYIKFDTKIKVLKTCLETYFLNTIEYILNRSGDRITDILRTVLSTIYSEAIETESISLFSNLLNKFKNIKTKYRGTIRDRLENEISEMNFILDQKASELAVPLPPKSINDISAKELVNMFSLIAMEYINYPLDPQKAAINLNFPLKEIKSIWSTLASIRPIQSANLQGEINVGYIVPPIAGTLTLDKGQLYYGVKPNDLDETAFANKWVT